MVSSTFGKAVEKYPSLKDTIALEFRMRFCKNDNSLKDHKIRSSQKYLFLNRAKKGHKNGQKSAQIALGVA